MADSSLSNTNEHGVFNFDDITNKITLFKKSFVLGHSGARGYDDPKGYVDFQQFTDYYLKINNEVLQNCSGELILKGLGDSWLNSFKNLGTEA